MKQIIKRHWKEIARVAVTVFVLSFAAVAVSGWLKAEATQDRIASLGIWRPLVVILYVTASHVFAPLAGSPGIVVSLSAFGLVEGWIYVYLASLLSAAVNFYIARNLGREWVIRLAGKDSTKKIDRFVETMGTRLLVMARLFGFPLYEFISYAAGFTAISFSKYMVITALVGLVPGIAGTAIMYRSLGSPWLMAAFMGTLVTIGAVFSWYTVWLYLKRRQ